jgi:lyso-ornithine lipid O-acyltransferase
VRLKINPGVILRLSGGAGCELSPTFAAIMGRFLAYTRLSLFALVTALLACVVTLVVLIAPNNARAAIRVKQAWIRFCIWVIGLRVEYQGTFPQECVLFLPNHRSYLDIVLIPARTLTTILAKQEVRKWPLIGYGAEKARIVFVDRKNPNSRQQTRETLRKRLAEGLNVVVFPEGTTYREGVGTYKPGMFQVAVEGNIAIVPAAIEYKDQNDAWVGDETFMPHFLRTAGRLHTPVKIRLGEPMRGTDVRELMEKSHAWTTQACADLRKEWDEK